MSLGFKKLRSPCLGLDDTITVGKLKGCILKYVIEEDYEYLIWANKSGLLKFNTEATKSILAAAGFAEEVRHFAEEVLPYLDDDPF